MQHYASLLASDPEKRIFAIAQDAIATDYPEPIIPALKWQSLSVLSVH